MIVYPAIDIIDAKCVRLRQGDFDQQTTYGNNPQELADEYAQAGAQWLHIVDLDAARECGENLQLIGSIANSSKVNIQSGGGVRRIEHIGQRLEAGISRVVVGSAAVKQPQTFCDWLRAFGSDALTVALDVRQIDGRWSPAVSGWRENTNVDLHDLLAQFLDAGLKHMLCTDIGRDGMMEGPNIDLYSSLKMRYPQLQLQASGGVHALADLTELQLAKVDGVIIGKALLDGRFTVPQALEKVS